MAAFANSRPSFQVAYFPRQARAKRKGEANTGFLDILCSYMQEAQLPVTGGLMRQSVIHQGSDALHRRISSSPDGPAAPIRMTRRDAARLQGLQFHGGPIQSIGWWGP
jgi:hypothetical protein